MLDFKGKVKKKLKRLEHLICGEIDVKFVKQPSKHLAICNVGLVNGLTEETVFEHFQKLGQIAKIVLLPGKSYGFLSYQNENSARIAFEQYNGTLNIAQGNKPVFLAFIEALPKEVQSNNFNNYPPGLLLIENFITPAEEQTLLHLYNFEESSGQMKHRQVKHFGYEFRYDINNVDKDKPLPEAIPKECHFLWDRLAVIPISCRNFLPDQLTINHYSPGQGIPSHVDTHSAFEDPLLSLSLGSSVVMEFRKENEKRSILLPRYSLAILSQESRYAWQHGITPKKMDVILTSNGYSSLERKTRVSFTFRKILKEPSCKCSFEAYCDSRTNLKKVIVDKKAVELENLYVHEVYDNIAEHFSETRHKPWPNVLDFVLSFPITSFLVDVGCGNGKYLGKNNCIFELGCDRSFGLIDVCKRRGFEALIANCLNIPLKDNVADGVISIAVIHHMANKTRRLKALSEIVRILKVNGKALIYVWAKNQNQFDKRSNYLKDSVAEKNSSNNLSPNNNTDLPIHTNRTQFEHSDLLVPWKLKGGEGKNTFLRFYHVFEENELETLCKELGNVEIVRSYYDQGNWCIVLKKIKCL